MRLNFSRFSTSRFATTLAVVALGLGCAEQAPFDSARYLRETVRQEAAPAGVSNAVDIEGIVVPFELSAESVEAIGTRVRAAGDTRTRVARVLDYIFRGLDLQYRLSPTRDANGTLSGREGNCLSFVNLFVAVGRHVRLDPFYVEVEDYQRWDHRQGMVVSQGHIVAGLYVDGQLRTYDFLPYRVKSYRQFQPIDDRTATAHFHNNLGAEALLAGELERAREHLEIARRVDPAFVQAANNLGVWHARGGEPARAIEIYRQALEIDAGNVPVLTNLARAHQLLGESEVAESVLAQVEGLHHQNPFFFAYRGEAALARGDTAKALEFLRDALRIDTEIPEVHLGLGKTYLALGQVERAEHHVERAATLDPNHPELPALRALLGPLLQ